MRNTLLFYLFLKHVINWPQSSAFLPAGQLRRLTHCSDDKKLTYRRPSSCFSRETQSFHNCHRRMLSSAAINVDNDWSIRVRSHEAEDTPRPQSLSPPSSRQNEDCDNHKKISNRQKIKSMFRAAKGMERQGRWRDASDLYEKILLRDPRDAYSHLALARLEARREIKSQLLHNTSPIHYQQQKLYNNSNVNTRRSSSRGATAATINNHTTTNATSDTAIQNGSKARMAFSRGTEACPNNIHLKQAWAVFEESCGNIPRARELFEDALTLDERNPYVCHAFGLMEKKLGNTEKARYLFSQALQTKSTAALVCSLGELLIANREFDAARNLYVKHLLRLEKEKDKTEVYLASAWLEERYFSNMDRATELIQLALAHSPGSGVAQVALARLEGRIQRRSGSMTGGIAPGKDAAVKRLENACTEIERGTTRAADPNDGRLYNAWANMELRSRRYSVARKILQKGREMYPRDHSLCHAAGKVEERLGNFTGARDLYSESLLIEPSAPTLVSFALLDLRLPHTTTPLNFTKVRALFEEALLLDPRHGAAYNAYGNAEFQRGNVDEARAIFERGVRAECSDAASLYHGYGKLELSLGNVDTAREILERGLQEVRQNEVGMDSPHRDRAKFLYHTLGMLELNSNRPTIAKDLFQEGIARFGNSSQLLLGAGLCFVKLGNEDAARSLFEKSVLTDRKHAQAWQAWAVMESRAGNFKTATTLFKCGIKGAPKYGALWHAYAMMEAKLGHSANARMLFAGGVKKAPGHAPLYQGWASLELREKNLPAAKALITEALTRDKRNGAGWLIAAQIEASQGNHGLEGLLLRRGIECAPDDAGLYRTLGELLVSRGKIDQAREVFEKGIEVNPLHAPLYHSLAELEAMVFNVEGLAALNVRASKLFNNNALETPASSSQAWGTKIRAKRSRKLPEGVAALAQKIVDENDSGVLGDEEAERRLLDPMATLDSLTSALEDELVDGLLGVDPIADR